MNELARAMRAAAEDQGWKPGNLGENRVALALYRHGVRPTDIEQQFQLGPYRIDFAFVAERIALEADGWVHTTRRAQARDRERDHRLADWGWFTIRVDVDSPDWDFEVEVAAIVRAARRDRGQVA